MAKDEYYVLVYKVLLYLYACLKRKIYFNNETFDKATKRKDINEDYFDYVLYMMQKEGYIDGLAFTKVWGNTVLRTNEIENAVITEKGISFLTENDKMNKIKDYLLGSVDWIVSLIHLVFN